MEFNKLFRVNTIETEIKRIENVVFEDVATTALKVRDKTIEEVTALFDSIVTTIEYDIDAIKKGIQHIEDELLSLVEKKSLLEDNKKILISHHDDLSTALTNAEKTALSISSINALSNQLPETNAVNTVGYAELQDANSFNTINK